MRYFIRPKKTRKQWLRECTPSWRELMSTIQQSPDEVAAEAGLATATVRKVVRGFGNPGRHKHGTVERIVAAVLRLRGEDAHWEDMRKEATHMYHLSIGCKPHYNDDAGGLDREGGFCRLCSRADFEAEQKRIAAIVLELRDLAKRSFSEDEWRDALGVVYADAHALRRPFPPSANALLAKRLHLLGLESLAVQIMPSRRVLRAAIRSCYV